MSKKKAAILSFLIGGSLLFIIGAGMTYLDNNYSPKGSDETKDVCRNQLSLLKQEERRCISKGIDLLSGGASVEEAKNILIRNFKEK